MPRYTGPAAADVFAGLPAAREDGAALRASIRAMRASGRVLTGVIDDDPTGSQAMHGVEVVTVPEQSACEAALSGPAGACFVLTNSRSLDEPEAAALTDRAARALLAAASASGRALQLVSRSDSTLRGHITGEAAALQAAGRDMLGSAFDAVLLIPAFLEAGRVTAADVHWARTAAGLVPVGETEFARDSAFGYAASDLREFLAEKSGGAVRPQDVASISLGDIRTGGPSRVRDLLAGLAGGTWVVVNATEYADLEAVACGVLLAEQSGRRFLFRTGPSFVRALTGTEPAWPLRGAALRPRGHGTEPGGAHGLIVVGSHVGQTSRQLAVLRERAGLTGVELCVPAILDGPAGHRRPGGTGRRRRAPAVGRAAVHQPGRRRGRQCRREPGDRARRLRGRGAHRPAGAGVPARLDPGQGRRYLARCRGARARHPPGGGGGPAVPRPDLSVPSRRCSA